MFRPSVGSADALLTIADVLSYLRVDAETVYRLIHDGDLPAIRMGWQWRVRRRDLDRYLAAQRIAAASPIAVNE